ncbi:MAG TPA: prolyl oligopeptidase family serine peptidase [Azospirillaceae bacterium]|nr:prolyl oligopeptidase family serine peptidase [Azospirillaceae bacterium]
MPTRMIAAAALAGVAALTGGNAMAEPKIAPYGTWESPVSAEALANGAVRLGSVGAAGGKAYWTESRPAQKGRGVVVTPDGTGGIRELVPEGFNARTRVHEYGGTPYAVVGDTLYFSHFADQRLHAVPLAGGQPRALTPEGHRYADCVADPAAPRLYCVREDHGAPGSGSHEPRNLVAAVPTAGSGAGTALWDKADFVAYPRPSPDGRHLAWIAWDHPNMPWDTTTLYVAEVTPQGLGTPVVVAGGREESVTEPRWDADGTLYFISDRTDWWNLYRWKGGKVEAVTREAAEFAGPLWTLGQANYALTGDGRAVLRYGVKAVDRLALLDLATGALTPFDLPYVGFGSVALLDKDHAVMLAASAAEEPAVIEVELSSGAHRVLRRPGGSGLAPDLVSRAEAIEFPTKDDKGAARTAHAFFYPPANPAYRAPEGEKPPLIVGVHGGPTGHRRPEFELEVQYWTSRGIAFVDVNYSGSSGYGRAYRQRLNGAWGVADVEDVVAAVDFLVKSGRVDPKRVAIRGGSAGGFTTLAALAFRDTFKAGANYYGVSDMEALARETHKFESRYLDGLVAPLPEGIEVYKRRSPINNLDGFNEPLITFQGSEDAVVPPAQSRAIVEALKSKGVPVAYEEFEGEQHGFRKAESIVRSKEAELYFYGRIFGFTPAGDLRPIRIDNLPEN